MESTMDLGLASKILKINSDAYTDMAAITELAIPYRARLAAQAGIYRAAMREIAGLMLDAGLANEPAVPDGMPNAAINGIYEEAYENIAKAALSAAAVAVMEPFMPMNSDI